MDPIVITLSLDAQQAAESVGKFVGATTEAIERSYTQAVDKAQAKLDELTRKQEIHRQVIEANGQAVAALQAKRDTASEAEQKNLDQEIKRLQQLTQQRLLDINRIDEQKAKLEEKGLLALGATEAERKALQDVTNQRLIDLGAIRNSIQAHDSVKDAAEAANKSAADGLDKVTEKRTVLEKVLEAEKQKLAEMQGQKETASSAEQKRIDGQIDAQKKIISARQDELLVLDSKRVKLEEEQQLANATNQQEEADIRNVTAAKLAQIEVDRDAIRVQHGLKESASDTGSAIAGMVAQAGKLVGVVSVAAAIATAFQASTQSIEANRQVLMNALSAADQIRSKQLDTFASTQGAFAELGITDPKAKQAALEALRGAIPEQQGLTPDVVVRTAQGMGSALRGVDPSSSKFADIVGNASQAVYQGMDPSLVKNVYTDMLRENPNTTGAQLNKRLADLNTRAGSPAQANELMQIVQEQRSRYGMLGMGTEDVEKMFVSAGQNGIAPEERGSAVSGYLRGLDRFAAKTPEQYLKLYEEMTGVRQVPGQGEFLSTASKFMSPAQLLQKEMSMRHLQSFGELDSLFKAGVSGKTVDMRTIASAIGGMSRDRMEQVVNAGGGPRATAASLAVGNWSGVSLPSGGSFSAPSTAQEQAASKAAVDEFKAINAQQVDPALASFQAQMEVEQKLLAEHPEYLPEITRNYQDSNFFTKGARQVYHAFGGIASPQEVAASNVMAKQFIKDARLQQAMLSGKVQATQKEKDEIYKRLRSEADGIIGVDGKNGAIFKAMQNQSYDLPDLSDDKATRDWMLKNVNYQRNTASNMDEVFSGISQFPFSGGYLPPNSHQINPVAKPIPAAPKIGPQSINYNVKMTNYGYTGDALSNMRPPSNNFG
jgi:hypothetical protein